VKYFIAISPSQVGVLRVYGELDPCTLVSPITDALGRQPRNAGSLTLGNIASPDFQDQIVVMRYAEILAVRNCDAVEKGRRQAAPLQSSTALEEAMSYPK